MYVLHYQNQAEAQEQKYGVLYQGLVYIVGRHFRT